MFNLVTFALTSAVTPTTTGTPAQAANDLTSTLSMVALMAVVFGLMYLLMIRPQKKKEKALREQISTMAVGDGIVTIGGVIGQIVNIKDEEVTISTSVAKTLMTFKKSAIATIIKPENAIN